MKNKLRIGIVGFGNMGRAISESLIREDGFLLSVYEKDKKIIKGISSITFFRTSRELILNNNIIILAIRPQDITGFIQRAKKAFLKSRPLIISIAAGVSTHFLEKIIKQGRIIRVMPNLAVRVKEAVSFVCRGKFTNKKDLTIAKNILNCAGKVFVVRESFLDKATSISGSGPGYIYFYMKCMFKCALKLGFNREMANQMVLQTFLGSAKLARLSGRDFSLLEKDVTSPGGTTEQALKIFKIRKLDKIIEEAVTSAYQRAEELAKIYK